MGPRIVDLTYPIHEGMTTFPVPWHPVVEITQLGRHGIENRETRKVVLGTHTGTHCDAPRHFVPGGSTVDQIPLSVLVGPALVLDLTAAPEGTGVEPADLEGRVKGRKAERLVLRFGWDRFWGSRRYYSGHPYLTKASARWLVERGVRLLGMDTPMPDNPGEGAGSQEDSPIHKILLGSQVILLEYLANLGELRHEEVTLVALPLKIRDGDGSPVRCIAIESFAGGAG
jgi:kynurenine formamidase